METRQTRKLGPAALLKPKRLQRLDPNHFIVPEIVKYILTFTEGRKKKTFGAEKHLVQCEYVTRLGFQLVRLADCPTGDDGTESVDMRVDRILDDSGLPKEFFRDFRSRMRSLCEVVVLPPASGLISEQHSQMVEELHAAERPSSWLNRLRMTAMGSAEQTPSTDQMELDEPQGLVSESSVCDTESASASASVSVLPLVAPSAPNIDKSVQMFDPSAFSKETQSFWVDGPGAATVTSAATIAVLEKLQEQAKAVVWEWISRKWASKARQLGWSRAGDVDPQSIDDLVNEPNTCTETAGKYGANFEQCKSCIIYPKLVKSYLAKQTSLEPEQRKGMRTKILRTLVFQNLRFAQLHDMNFAALEKLAFVLVQVDAAHKIMSKKRLEAQRSLVFGLLTLKETTARSQWGLEEEKLRKRVQEGVTEQDGVTCQQLLEVVSQTGDVSRHWYSMLDGDLKIRKEGQ